MTTPDPAGPLDLVDVDGDRIRFTLNGRHTTEPVEIACAADDPDRQTPPDDLEVVSTLTFAQLAQIVRWGLLILGDGFADPPAAPSTSSPWAALVSRPYTDEELARGPSERRDQFLTDHAFLIERRTDHLPGCTRDHDPASSACPPYGHPERQGPRDDRG